MFRSHTTLEYKLFEGPLARWFARCLRPALHLTDLAAKISAEIAARQFNEFFQNRSAAWQQYRSRDGKWQQSPSDLTPGFVQYTEEVWPGGPGLLTVFGMGGIETLGWARALATRYPHLLLSTPFAMAEIRTKPIPKGPLTLAFLDSWEVRLLGVAPEPSRPGGPVSTSEPALV
jgi:hypothetical protein